MRKYWEKGYMSALVAVLLLGILMPWAVVRTVHAAVPFEVGTGTAGDPYIITTADQLDAVRDYPDKSFRLGADINLAEYANWEPISPFTGTFDGNGHVIRNMTIDHTGFYTGLFGISNGTIKNVGVVNTDVTGKWYTGGLVGIMEQGSVVTRSYVSGTVTGDTYTGGLVGFNSEGTITLSYSTATVTGGDYVGGLVGKNESVLSPEGVEGIGKIKNSFATGSVEGSEYLGGLIGSNFGGNATNSYAAGDVSGEKYLGGLVGSNIGANDPSTLSYFGGTINDSYASGTVTGPGPYVGDLYGDNSHGDMSTSAHKTDAEMKTQATFDDWDFTDIWAIDEGVSTPYLRENLADLSSLTLSKGTLSPAFDPAKTLYTANVANEVDAITVTPTVAADTATVTVNGGAVTSGEASAPIDLKVGDNRILVVVTAESDTAQKTYTITVHRAPSSNAALSGLTLSGASLDQTFDSDTTSYTSSVGNDVKSITVTPTVADDTAVVTVNGESVTSGEASVPIDLDFGDNPVKVVVTAQDEDTTETYTITVKRTPSSNTALGDLTLSKGTLSPAFDPAKTAYTVNVENEVDAITVTPTVADDTATVTVNGESVTSGEASAPIDLNVGDNKIPVVVTAEDGTTMKTYEITVNRAEALQDLVYSAMTKDGDQVTFSDHDIAILAGKGTLVFNLTGDFSDVTQVSFTKEQLGELKDRHATIRVVKDDVSMEIPVSIFQNDGLTIELEKLTSQDQHLSHFKDTKSAVYDFTFHQGDREIHTFSREVVLAFTVHDKTDNPNQLKVFYWNEPSQKWEKVGGAYKDGKVTVSTNHFSTYAVFDPSDLQEAAVSPPPQNHDKSDGDLPKTSSPMYIWLAAGLMMVMLGAALFCVRLRKNVCKE